MTLSPYYQFKPKPIGSIKTEYHVSMIKLALGLPDSALRRYGLKHNLDALGKLPDNSKPSVNLLNSLGVAVLSDYGISPPDVAELPMELSQEEREQITGLYTKPKPAKPKKPRKSRAKNTNNSSDSIKVELARILESLNTIRERQNQ